MGGVNGSIKGSNLIDLSVQDQSIRDAKKAFCDMLSERVLIALINGGDHAGPDALIVERAWHITELQFDEMTRRRNLNPPVTFEERQAVQNILTAA